MDQQATQLSGYCIVQQVLTYNRLVSTTPRQNRVFWKTIRLILCVCGYLIMVPTDILKYQMNLSIYIRYSYEEKQTMFRCTCLQQTHSRRRIYISRYLPHIQQIQNIIFCEIPASRIRPRHVFLNIFQRKSSRRTSFITRLAKKLNQVFKMSSSENHKWEDTIKLELRINDIINHYKRCFNFSVSLSLAGFQMSVLTKRLCHRTMIQDS